MDTTLLDEAPERDEMDIESMGLRQMIVETYKFVREIKQEYDQNTEQMEISSKELEDLLGMGDRTLTRWRTKNVLRYHLDTNGHPYHLYTEVYNDVKSGRIKGKGFNKQACLHRLKAYRMGILKGKLDMDYYYAYGR